MAAKGEVIHPTFLISKKFLQVLTVRSASDSGAMCCKGSPCRTMGNSPCREDGFSPLREGGFSPFLEGGFSPFLEGGGRSRPLDGGGRSPCLDPCLDSGT